MCEIAEKLQDPFPMKDIEWRIQSCGVSTSGKPWARALAYVTNRAIQERLDSVFGVSGWKNEYKDAPLGGVLCGISIWDKDHKHWVTKWDGADNTATEAIKGGLSASMKRAGAQLGIGRYLYNLDLNFVECSLEKPSNNNDWSMAHDKKSGQCIYWKKPTSLPKWALPKNNNKDMPESLPSQEPTSSPKENSLDNEKQNYNAFLSQIAGSTSKEELRNIFTLAVRKLSGLVSDKDMAELVKLKDEIKLKLESKK